MRYYDIQVSDSSGKIVDEWTSFPKGVNDLNALEIEFDIPLVAFDAPQGGSFVRIWGVPLSKISQSFNYNPVYATAAGGADVIKTISIYGGMQKGLPLANPKQAGLLVTGSIQQAFGNWVGTDQTLDLIFTAGNIDAAAISNLTFSWPAGTALSTVINTVLDLHFPKIKRTINISSSLVLPNAEPGFYGTLTQFATYVRQISQSINKDASYPGVAIYVKSNEFIVTDATTQKTPTAILFQEMIGQPTWQNIATINFMTAVRSDLMVGDFITLPKTLATTSAQSYAAYRNTLSFSGVFQITQIRHVGRFRSPSAESWVTVINATNIANQTATTTSGSTTSITTVSP